MCSNNSALADPGGRGRPEKSGDADPTRSGDLLQGHPGRAEALKVLRPLPGVHKVEIRLLLEAGESYSSYEVTVNHEEGDEVVSPQVLTAPPEGEPLTLRLPAHVLPAGSYFVTVKGITGEGTPEEVGFPRFRVQR